MICKSNFYSPVIIVIWEAYCWMDSTLLVLSVFWLTDLIQLLWPKLSKLTDSIRHLLVSYWIALLGHKRTPLICFNLLDTSYSLVSAASDDLQCIDHTNQTTLRMKCKWIQPHHTDCIDGTNSTLFFLCSAPKKPVSPVLF